jgi:hypothetical protein
MALILKAEGHDESREIEFELDFLAGLTVEERINLVLERSRLLFDMLADNGHPITPGISKRE